MLIDRVHSSKIKSAEWYYCSAAILWLALTSSQDDINKMLTWLCRFSWGLELPFVLRYSSFPPLFAFLAPWFLVLTLTLYRRRSAHRPRQTVSCFPPFLTCEQLGGTEPGWFSPKKNGQTHHHLISVFRGTMPPVEMCSFAIKPEVRWVDWDESYIDSPQCVCPSCFQPVWTTRADDTHDRHNFPPTLADDNEVDKISETPLSVTQQHRKLHPPKCS